MLNSVKKFRPAGSEFVYPFFIQTDRDTRIQSICKPFVSLLCHFGFIDHIDMLVADVFSRIGYSTPDLKNNFPSNNLPLTIDLFFEYPSGKQNSIRWTCTQQALQKKQEAGWQLSGVQIPVKKILSLPVTGDVLLRNDESEKFPGIHAKTRTWSPEKGNVSQLKKTGLGFLNGSVSHPCDPPLSQLLDRITDGFFILDETLCVTCWNDRATEVTGLNADKMMGGNIHDNFPALVDENNYKSLQTAIRKKIAFSAEPYYSKTGLWLEMNACPYEGELFVYLRNVTNRKKQEILLELEKKVLEINSDQHASLRHTIDYFLEGIEKIFPGMLCSVLLVEDGAVLRQLSAPSLPVAFSAATDGIKAGPLAGSCGSAVYTKKRVIVNDIQTDRRWESYRDFTLSFNLFACWSLPLMDANGDVLATFAIYYAIPKSPDEAELNIMDRAANLVRIIIENKRAEEKISVSNERYLLATKATNDVIWDWNIKSALPGFVWSDAFYTQFGFKRTASAERRSFWESHIHPDDRQRVVDGINCFIAHKETGLWKEEYRFKKSNGRYALVSDRGSLIYDKEGKAIRMVGAMQDITEKRRMEKSLLKQEINRQQLIVQAVVNAQEKERAEIGKELHDNVNQILSTTKLYLEHARSNDDERINLIERSVKNINQAINEIRNISRSLVPPSIGDLGLIDSINDLLENIKAIKAIHVEFYPVGNFEQQISDQQKLTLFRIIQEQVNNVLNHSEAKHLIIELILDEKENRIELNIADDGKGFEPSKMKTKKGLGISNIISRAGLFGGHVSIVSAKDKGCKLSVQVPIHNL